MIRNIENLKFDEALEALTIHGRAACAEGEFEGVWGLVHIGELYEENLVPLVKLLSCVPAEDAPKLTALQAAALELERRRRLDLEEPPRSLWARVRR